jgi:hypothetical protein
MTPTPLYRAIAVALAAGALTACGGGGGGSTTPTGTSSITSVGTITGFGSIYVNGVEYETDSTVYTVDADDDDLEDQSSDDSSMRVGMKVRVRGEINEDGRTGRADSVLYDEDIEGPIQNLVLDTVAGTATFDIFGLEILADDSTNFDDGSLATLENDQVYEVSGNFDGTRLVATFMDRQDDPGEEFEVKGTVTAYEAFVEISIDLINGAPLTLSIDPNAVVEISGDPIGQFVELKIDPATNLVIKIEDDDDDLLDDDDDGKEIEISGVLTDGTSTEFELNGIPLVFTSSTEYEPASLEGNLAAGLFVEVEGTKDGDNLLVREIETEEGEIEIEAPVGLVTYSGPKTGTITLEVGAGQTIDVRTDTGTLFKDDSSLDLDDDDSFNLDELTSGDFLEIEAYLDDSGDVVATEVRREDEMDDVEVQAPLQAENPLASVTVLDVTWTVDAGTAYRLEDSVIDAQTFFDLAGQGTPIKLRDDYMADGVADELEIESDDD